MSQPNTSPLFPDSILVGQGVLSVANTDRTGATGTLVTIATGTTKGTRVDRVRIMATAATTQGKIYLFKTDTGGANPRLYDEVDVTALTPGATISGFAADLVRTDGLPYCTLDNGQLLRAAPRLGETFHVNCEGGNY
jgi:hypothetical protein